MNESPFGVFYWEQTHVREREREYFMHLVAGQKKKGESLYVKKREMELKDAWV
ncbi:unnamed protein product [Camellia sinensis]